MKVSAVLVGVNVAATLSVALQNQASAQDGTAAFLKASLSDAVGKSTISKARQDRNGLAAEPASAFHTNGGIKSSQERSSASRTALGGTSKSSLSDPRSVAARRALCAQGVKLRPFVPNRKLPSRQDLAEAALESQSAELDYAPTQSYQSAQAVPTALTGTISESAPFYVSTGEDVLPMSARGKYEIRAQQRRADSKRLQNAAKAVSAYHRQLTPKAVPGSATAVPGQIGYPCAQMSIDPTQPVERMRAADPRGTLMFSSPEALAMHSLNKPAFQGASMPFQPQTQFQPQMQFQAPQQGAMQFQPQGPVQPLDVRPSQIPPEAPMRPMNLSPQEQIEMNRLLEMTNAQNGGSSDDLYGRVGAPPFPLCLIPEPCMKGFLKKAHERHSYATDNISTGAMSSGIGGAGGAGGNGGFSSMGAGGGPALPAAGFRSYVHGAKTVMGMRSFSRIPTAMPIKQTAHGNQIHCEPGSAKRTRRALSQPSVSLQPSLDNQRGKAFTYPPYKSSVNFGS